mmetsp:Transcript_15579/g.51182  ORF Transcript_15579/g.51182 Transcript_15579/m.51182 type:complete len:425 (+) Transcript_15579:901-2175(+)
MEHVFVMPHNLVLQNSREAHALHRFVDALHPLLKHLVLLANALHQQHQATEDDAVDKDARDEAQKSQPHIASVGDIVSYNVVRKKRIERLVEQDFVDGRFGHGAGPVVRNAYVTASLRFEHELGPDTRVEVGREVHVEEEHHEVAHERKVHLSVPDDAEEARELWEAQGREHVARQGGARRRRDGVERQRSHDVEAEPTAHVIVPDAVDVRHEEARPVDVRRAKIDEDVHDEDEVHHHVEPLPRRILLHLEPNLVRDDDDDVEREETQDNVARGSKCALRREHEILHLYVVEDRGDLVLGVRAVAARHARRYHALLPLDRGFAQVHEQSAVYPFVRRERERRRVKELFHRVVDVRAQLAQNAELLLSPGVHELPPHAAPRPWPIRRFREQCAAAVALTPAVARRGEGLLRATAATTTARLCWQR